MNPLAELLASIGDIAAMSTEDLAELRANLKTALRSARDGELSAEVIGHIEAGVAKANEIKGVLDERAQAAADIVAAADTALAALGDEDEEDGNDDAGNGTDEGDAADGDDGDAGDGAGTQPGPEAPEPDAPGAAETPQAAAPAIVEPGAPDINPIESEAIAASGMAPTPAPAALNPHVVVPARHRPQPNRAARRKGFVASGEVPGIAPGHQFGDTTEVFAALAAKQQALGNSQSEEKHYVASFNYQDAFGDRRVDDSMSADAITEVFLRAGEERKEALVAAGGIQGPPEPRYDQVVYGQTDRPVWDAQAGVNAARGTIIYTPAPTLDDIIVDDTGGAIDTITNTDDINDTSKTVQTITGGTPVQVTVRATTIRLKNGNAFDRFYPERGRAFAHLAQVAWARHADMLLLQDMKTLSVKYTDAIAELGAYRDLRAQVEGLVAEVRDHLRDYSVPIHAVFPAFLPDMLAIDMTRQQPGDHSFDIAVAQMKADIASWGITPHWAKDSIRGRLLSTPTQNPPGAPRTPKFDSDVEWCLYPEGTFLTLDGGTLDLGIVRDSTLNQTNKFETFFEAWEAIARVGPYAYWVTSSLCPSGTSAAPTTSIVCEPGGS